MLCLLNICNKYVSGGYFTFQQDSAPAHRARVTLDLLSQATPDFIPLQLWPPNSSDSPVDYHIWSVLKQWMYRTYIRDVDPLVMRLVEEWQMFDQKVIDLAIKQRRIRLWACGREKG